MGLDMYLSAKLYVSDYTHNNGEHTKQFAAILAAAEIDDAYCRRCGTPGLEVAVTVASWRKANQIHRWFVEHCQDGNDDCGHYYVSREQLEALVALCKQVLSTVETVDGQLHNGTTYYPDGTSKVHLQPGQVVAQTEIAHRLLPTAAGFFFGGTDYDQYYLDHLTNTVNMLEPVLADKGLAKCDFEYHSSW